MVLMAACNELQTTFELNRPRRSDDPVARGATKALHALNDMAALQLSMIPDCAELTLQRTRF